MPINAHPDYLASEKEYLSAYSPEEKLKALEKMISLVPKHKGAENLRAQLKQRYKKLKGQIEKNKKSGTGKKAGIKKEDMQAVIIGLTNSGKSSLLSLLTNTSPEISENKFATKKPIVGMMPYSGTNIQLIEIPAFGSEFYGKGLVHSADIVLITAISIEQIKPIIKELPNKKKIIIFNATNQNENELRKIRATLQSKKYDFVIIDLRDFIDVNKNKIPKNYSLAYNGVGGERFQIDKNKEIIHHKIGWGWAGSLDGASSTGSRVSRGDGGGTEELNKLREKIFQSFDKIRIYTKHAGKEGKHAEKPIILPQNSTIKDVAEKIFHGFSNKIKEAFVTGPSGKFPRQKVGLNHKLKDLDIVEFKTR
ncbi:MAG: GTPase [archaeon]